MRQRFSLTALLPLPVLLALAGCASAGSAVGSQQGAKNAGRGLANTGIDAGKAAGQKAQDIAVHDPHLAAAAIVAVIGATLVRWLWRSAQIKYLAFGAAVAWIAYAVGTAR